MDPSHAAAPDSISKGTWRVENGVEGRGGEPGHPEKIAVLKEVPHETPGCRGEGGFPTQGGSPGKKKVRQRVWPCENTTLSPRAQAP